MFLLNLSFFFSKSHKNEAICYVTMHTSGYLTVWFQYSARNAAPFQSKISSEPRTMSLAVQSVSRNWLIYGSEKRKTGLRPLTDTDAAASVSPSSARLTAMRTYSSSTDLERCLCEILSIFTRTLLHCWTFQFITVWCRGRRTNRPLLLSCLYICPKNKSIPRTYLFMRF